MIPVLCIFILLLLLILLWLFLTAPNLHGRRAEHYRGTPYAHRGLHGEGAAENSLEAFSRAVEHGFGMELDVQLSRDGALVVFHDDSLKRMTGDPRNVCDVDLAELKTLDLGSGCRIPTFEELLNLVDGRTPLLVELKNTKRNAELCEKTAAMLDAYKGDFITESFNPFIMRWMKKNRPQFIRGQLVTNAFGYGRGIHRVSGLFLSSLLLNAFSRPDFIAYNVECPRLAAAQRKFFKTPLAAWTIRDKALYDKSKSASEMPIFEKFIP